MSNLHEIEQISLMNTQGFVEEGGETKAVIAEVIALTIVVATCLAWARGSK